MRIEPPPYKTKPLDKLGFMTRAWSKFYNIVYVAIKRSGDMETVLSVSPGTKTGELTKRIDDIEVLVSSLLKNNKNGETEKRLK